MEARRRTETGAAPRRQGATTENTNCIRVRSIAAGGDASFVECSRTSTAGCHAVGVGALLIGINHGDAILRGDVSTDRIGRMILTVMSVSTASSVSALRDQLKDQSGNQRKA